MYACAWNKEKDMRTVYISKVRSWPNLGDKRCSTHNEFDGFRFTSAHFV